MCIYRSIKHSDTHMNTHACRTHAYVPQCVSHSSQACIDSTHTTCTHTFLSHTGAHTYTHKHTPYRCVCTTPVHTNADVHIYEYHIYIYMQKYHTRTYMYIHAHTCIYTENICVRVYTKAHMLTYRSHTCTDYVPAHVQTRKSAQLYTGHTHIPIYSTKK